MAIHYTIQAIVQKKFQGKRNKFSHQKKKKKEKKKEPWSENKEVSDEQVFLGAEN